MESTITKKFTFISVRESDASIENLTFSNEKWFLRTMCESQAAGFKIIYAAVISINNDTVINITVLNKYMSDIN